MNQQHPGDGSSAFKARLDALRAKGPAPPPPQLPSLKERLQANPAGSTSADDIRAQIRARFQKKTTMPAASHASSVAADSTAPEQGSPPVIFEAGADIPEIKVNKSEKTTEIWSAEYGGVCPACNTFNPSTVVFCGSCGYMLLRSEQEVEIITSYALTEIKGLAHAFVDKLKELNIQSTEDILRVASNRKNRETISKRTGLSERSILRLVHISDLCRIPSINPENIALLELLAINTLADLLKFKPLELYNKIQQNRIKINQQGIMFLPTKSQVTRWLEEAAQLPPIRISQ